jgi:hypothetical protein
VCFVVIARSEATKQSIVRHVLRHGLLRFARNDGLYRGCLKFESEGADCTHLLSSPAKAGDPVFRDVRYKTEKRGVLDTPLSRGMTASGRSANSDV